MKKSAANTVFGLIGSFFILSLILPVRLLSQSEDGNDKHKARISLSFHNDFSDKPFLKAILKTKSEGTFHPVQGETIHFYKVFGDDEIALGKAFTGADGEAVLLLDTSLISFRDSEFEHEFVAALETSDKYQSTSADAVVKEALLSVSFTEEDSNKVIFVKVESANSDGDLIGVEDVEVEILVERMFRPLPIGNGAELTDEEGELRVEFPAGIPGHDGGVLNVIVRVPDHETFGTLEERQELLWGVQSQYVAIDMRGQLWAARKNAPVYLVVLVNAILAAIWFTIFYIITLILKIRKLGFDFNKRPVS